MIYSLENLVLPGPDMAFHAVPLLDMKIREIIGKYQNLLLSYIIWLIYIYEIHSEALISSSKNLSSKELYLFNVFNFFERVLQLKETKTKNIKAGDSKKNSRKVLLNFICGLIVLANVFVISNYLIKLPTSTLQLELTGNESGLIGKYSTIIATQPDDILVKPRFKRLDNKINFDWSDHPPKRSFPSHDYMINWEGLIKIDQKGIYHFITQSDDGVRFWIDQQMLIDDWKIHGVEENIASIELTPGWHSIRLDYLQKGGNAVIRLLWEPPGNPRQIIPEAYFRPDVSKTTSQQNE
jgi:hypothetical protein